MKNFHIYIAITTFLLISIVFASCKKDDADRTKPTINLVEPTDGDALKAGDEIHFNCEFADDIELKSYKIDINAKDVGHTHTKHAENPWTYNNTWNFDVGKKNINVHHHEIVIPETIGGFEIKHGTYHFGVYCTDATGNERSVFIDIEIESAQL